MALGSAGPVEAKVSWSSLAATVLTGLVFAANHTDAIPGYDAWPTWAKAVVSIVVIAGGTFGAGFVAPHTSRPVLADPNRVADRADLDQGLSGSNVRMVPGKTSTTGGYRGGDVTPPD